MGLGDLEKDFGSAKMERDFPEEKTKPASTLGQVGQIVKDEFWKSGERHVENLKGFAQGIVNPKMQDVLPWTVAGPAGKTAATGIGQGIKMAFGRSGATGVGAAVDAPQGKKIESGLKAGGVALAWEAALGLVPHLGLRKGTSLAAQAKGLEGREKEFQKATAAPMKAYEALKDQVPPEAWMNVPSISKTPITFKEASQGLEKLKGVDWEAARNEIFSELERGGSSLLSGPKFSPPIKAAEALKDSSGKAPYAAERFKIRTPTTPFDPPSTEAERFAKHAVGTLKSPGVRTGVDVGASQEGPGDVPVGVWPLAAVGTGTGSLYENARRWIHR